MESVLGYYFLPLLLQISSKNSTFKKISMLRDYTQNSYVQGHTYFFYIYEIT